MFYKAELAFLQRLLENFRLRHHLVTDCPLPELDMGIRNLLRLDQTYRYDTDLFSSLIRPNRIYRISDDFFCNYIALRLPDAEPSAIMIIGPYTNRDISRRFMQKFTGNAALAPELLPQVQQYYSRLPFLPDEGPLLLAVQTFGEVIWGENQFSVEVIELPNAAAAQDMAEKAPPLDNADFSIKVLESRYAAENNLMREVSLGQLHRAEQRIVHFQWAALDQRSADPIRNKQNYLVILNTLLRKAAEQGGVHPLYIDRLSTYFARKIELLGQHGEAADLMKEMTRRYCRLVNQYARCTYSPQVQRVMMNIDCDLTADLSLSVQARLLNVNSSYLSALFRKETGSTLTDYVNRRRIEYAEFLLTATTFQIQAVAQKCGILDLNYFSRLFKKYTGTTPKAYRENSRGTAVL